MAKAQIDKVLTGLAGEFLVAGYLSLKGYVASLTLKNYPGVDIFCLNPKNGKQVAVQVKTLRGGKSYYIPENVDESKNPFVFVHIHAGDTVEFFVVPAKRVAEISATERSEYLRSRPHVRKDQPRMLSVDHLANFKDRWDLLGLE